MKTISLHIGDTLIVTRAGCFDTNLHKGQKVTVVRFTHGNAHRENEDGYCPVVQTAGGDEWFTDMKELFHNFKKEK